MDRKALGKKGEQAGSAFLREKGYTILETNYRTRLGEIDLIARKEDIIIFIEVKTRRTTIYGLPRESVHYTKQQTYGKLALQYLQRKGWLHKPARFDVLDILMKEDGAEIQHIVNAFEFQNNHFFY